MHTFYIIDKETIMDVKRYHTRRKEILKFADVNLATFGLEKEFSDFMAYVDEIDQADPDALTTGQWKKLFAFLRSLADKTKTNYCIYQNKSNIFFDVTSNCIGLEDEIAEDDTGSILVTPRHVKESSIDRLKRYKHEIEQIDLKIAHLQERRKEYIERLEPLKMELASLLDDLSGYGG